MGTWQPPIPSGVLYSPPALDLGPALAMLAWCYDGVEHDGTVRVQLDQAAATLNKPYRTIKDWWRQLRAAPIFAEVRDCGRQGYVVRFEDDWLDWRIMANNYPPAPKAGSRPAEGQDIARDTAQGPLKDISRTDKGQDIALDAPAYKVLHVYHEDMIPAASFDAPAPPVSEPPPLPPTAPAPPVRSPRKGRARPPAEDVTPTCIREALARECAAESGRMLARVNKVAKSIWARQQGRNPPRTAEQTAAAMPEVTEYLRTKVYPYKDGQPLVPEAFDDQWVNAAQWQAERRRTPFDDLPAPPPPPPNAPRRLTPQEAAARVRERELAARPPGGTDAPRTPV
mgnify:CR=1 FL=1